MSHRDRGEHFLVEAETGQPGHDDGAGRRYTAVPQVVGLDFPALVVAAALAVSSSYRNERAFMRVRFEPFSRLVRGLVAMDVGDELEGIIAGSAAGCPSSQDEP